MKRVVFLLTGMLIITLSACLQNTAPSNPSAGSVAQVVHITADKAAELLASDTALVLLDVRTPEEIADGYISGTDLFIDVSGTAFQNEIQRLDPKKTYVVYCRSGARSARAAEQMVKSGFVQVYTMDGGIGAWNGAISH